MSSKLLNFRLTCAATTRLCGETHSLKSPKAIEPSHASGKGASHRAHMRTQLPGSPLHGRWPSCSVRTRPEGGHQVRWRPEAVLDLQMLVNSCTSSFLLPSESQQGAGARKCAG